MQIKYNSYIEQDILFFVVLDGGHHAMGVAVAQQSSRAAGSIIFRYQGPAAERDPAASPIERRVERGTKVAPYRALPVEIFARRHHNWRLFCVEEGNLHNKCLCYIVLNLDEAYYA